MHNLLCIETSGKACSVALFQNTDLKAFKSIVNDDFKHAEALHLLVGESLKAAGLDLHRVHAVAVSQGPGSYTGLRVGVSAAKGLCYALGIPLIGVNTLQVMAAHAHALVKTKPQKWVALIDARREEVYLQEFDQDLRPLAPARAVILTDESFSYNNTVFCGDGSIKAQKYFQGEGLVFLPEAIAMANYMGTYADEAFVQNKFEDVAYFEPFYLKEFYTKGK